MFFILAIRSSCQVHGECDCVKPDRAMVGIINKASADVNINAVDNNGWSALPFTVLCENLKATKIIIRNKCDVNLQTALAEYTTGGNCTPCSD